MAKDIAVIVGSLRKESLNRKTANALRELAPASLKLEIVEIGGLPLYNQDSIPTTRRRAVERIPRAHRAAPTACCSSRRSTIARSRRAQECDRRRLAPLRPKRWDKKPGAVVSVVAGLDRRLRCQPSSAPVARVPQHAADAAAGSLSRRRRQAVRRSGKLVNETTREFLKNSCTRMRRGSINTRRDDRAVASSPQEQGADEERIEDARPGQALAGDALAAKHKEER